MGLGELQDLVSVYCNLTERQSRKVVRAILQSMTDALRRGESVTIPHLGTFKRHVRPATRYAMNLKPRPGQHLYSGVIDVPAKAMIKFTPCHSLVKDMTDDDHQ